LITSFHEAFHSDLINPTGDTMNTTDNLDLIRARYDAVNAHDIDRFKSFYGGSIVWNDPGLAKAVRGPTAVGNRLKALTESFPDLQWKLGRIFSQGEDVCAEFTFTGTHKGALKDPRTRTNLRASNRRVRIQAVGVYTVRDNRIVDSKIYFDFGTLISQLRARK
jgi:steroid delta-isomerase-like uncharacterized protein